MKRRKKYRIDEVAPDLIAINPGNVRDESEEQIQSDSEFQRLKESIYDFGVLVPLVIRPHKKSDKQYILIDGERRLRAALETNQEKVPVHIVTGTEAGDEVLYAFQIHTLRKQWPRIAQLRALRSIIKNVKKELGKRQEKQIFDIIQEKTGYKDTTLRDFFRVLRYAAKDKKVLDEMDKSKSNIKYSHLVQLEASFVEQLERLFPGIIKRYGSDIIRQKLLDKIRRGLFSTTRDPINKLLPLFMQAKNKEQKQVLEKLIIDFLDDTEKTPEDIYRSFEKKFPINKEDLVKLVEDAENRIEELESIINSIKTSQLKIYPKLKNSLRKKIDSLMTCLKRISESIKQG